MGTGIAPAPGADAFCAGTDQEEAMTDKRTQELADQSNMEKDPADWVTGGEPMTGAQRSYLKTLSEEAKLPFDENLNKADASRRIDELQQITGRGTHGGGGHGGQGGEGGPSGQGSQGGEGSQGDGGNGGNGGD